MLLLIVLFLNNINSEADPEPLCGIDFSITNAAKTFTSCFEKIPVNETELGRFVDTVIAFVKNSPYPLYFLNGATKANYTIKVDAFDVLDELEKLKASLSPTWSGTVLDFYEKIHDIIAKLRDPHFSISFPFLSRFLFYLPYGFAPVPGEGNGKKFKLVKNQLTDIHYSGTENPDGPYLGSIIDELDFGSGGSTSAFKPAADVLSAFASDVSWQGPDPNAQFNDVVKTGNVFTGNQLFRPTARYSAGVRLKGFYANGTEMSVTNPIPQINWYGAFRGTTIPETYDDLSPPAGAQPPPGGRSRNSENHIDKNSIQHFLPHMLHNQISPIHVERERMMKDIKQKFGLNSNFSANSGRYEPRLITSMYEKMLATRGPKPSPSPSRSVSPSLSPLAAHTNLPRAINAEEINLGDPLYTYDDDGANAVAIYADAVNKLGYIRYASFAQVKLADFLTGFGGGYKAMVDKGVTDVILDVRGNPGGFTLLVEELTDFFFHDTIYPADLDTDILLSTPDGPAGANFLQATIEYLASAQAGRASNYYTIKDGEEVPIDNVLDEPVTKNHTAKGGGTQKVQANYTERGFLKMRVNTPEGNVSNKIRTAFGGNSPFDPQHFYIITDGVCSSCCGIFTKQAIETKAARVFGYGVNPSKNDVSTYFPGNCAGSLLGTDQVDQIRAVLELLEDADFEPLGLTKAAALALLPAKFEREGVAFGVTDWEFFSRSTLANRANTTLYMAPAVVNDVLPIQASSVPDTLDVLKEIATVVKTAYIDTDYCAAGEVIVVEDAPCTGPIANGVYGKNCTNSKPTGSCAFAHCATGYFREGTGSQTKCSEIPDNYVPPPPGGDGGRAAGVAVPTLMLALVFAALMFWL